MSYKKHQAQSLAATGGCATHLTSCGTVKAVHNHFAAREHARHDAAEALHSNILHILSPQGTKPLTTASS
jgi:hypothetical protein